MGKTIVLAIALSLFAGVSVAKESQLSRYQKAKQHILEAMKHRDYTQADKDFCYMSAGDNHSSTQCAWKASQVDIAAFLDQYKKTKTIIRTTIKDHDKKVEFLKTLYAAVEAYSNLVAAQCTVETNEWWGGSGAGGAHAGCISRLTKKGSATLIYIDKILQNEDDGFFATRLKEYFEGSFLEELSERVSQTADGMVGTFEVAFSKLDTEFSHVDTEALQTIKKDFMEAQTTWVKFRETFCAMKTHLLYPNGGVKDAINMAKSISYCVAEQNSERMRVLNGEDR